MTLSACFCLLSAPVTQDVNSFIEASVVHSPTVFVCKGKKHVAYELRICNVSATDVKLTDLDVLDGDKPQNTPLLIGHEPDFSKFKSSMINDFPKLPPRTFSVVQIDLQLTNGVKTLIHRFKINYHSASDEMLRIVTGAPVQLETSLATISLPFGDGNWLAANAYSPTSIHRKAMMPINGSLATAQRYAIDWMKLGPTGKPFQDDPSKNSNWYSYGQQILAVSDGTVKLVQDDIPENTPLSPQRAIAISVNNAGGNCVVLDIGHGRYAFYGHLQPKSLKVKVGDKVRRGQVLGLLGNSGNSDAPHLHFHVADGVSVLGSQGEPFAFSSYVHVGEGSLGALFQGGASKANQDDVHVVKGELPYEAEILRPK